ncbi:hypothetical protein C1N77_17150 [Geobacillus thermoleovorans]
MTEMPYLCWAFLYTSTGVNSYGQVLKSPRCSEPPPCRCRLTRVFVSRRHPSILHTLFHFLIVIDAAKAGSSSPASPIIRPFLFSSPSHSPFALVVPIISCKKRSMHFICKLI